MKLDERQQGNADGPSELLSVRQAASLLGIGTSTLYSAIAAGRFPVAAVRVDRRMKLPRRRLIQWLEGEGSRDDSVPSA
jgi:excisionase family DNA binding protein